MALLIYTFFAVDLVITVGCFAAARTSPWPFNLLLSVLGLVNMAGTVRLIGHYLERVGG